MPSEQFGKTVTVRIRTPGTPRTMVHCRKCEGGLCFCKRYTSALEMGEYCLRKSLRQLQFIRIPWFRDTFRWCFQVMSESTVSTAGCLSSWVLGVANCP